MTALIHHIAHLIGKLLFGRAFDILDKQWKEWDA
jgi:hypothetical protein